MIKKIIIGIALFVLQHSAVLSNNKNYDSNLPIPRFASIKSNEVNARSGPEIKSPIQWVFIKKGEPIEIIAEYEKWRQIRDIKGEGGWVHSSVVSGKRTVVIVSLFPVPLLKKIISAVSGDAEIIENQKDNNSYFIHHLNEPKKQLIINQQDIVARLAPELRCVLKKCKENWCYIDCSGYTGWILKKYCWGA